MRRYDHLAAKVIHYKFIFYEFIFPPSPRPAPSRPAFTSPRPVTYHKADSSIENLSSPLTDPRPVFFFEDSNVRPNRSIFNLSFRCFARVFLFFNSYFFFNKPRLPPERSRNAYLFCQLVKTKETWKRINK